MSDIPVIFMAFANEKIDNTRYLRGLAVEQRKLKEALEPAVDAGLCELVVETNATIQTIINTFQKARYRDRIAVFHYAGHADGYRLLLETADNSNEVAHGEGLVSFLSGQKGLRFIFLNGCSTQQQATELAEKGIPAVIGTSQSISDEVATELGVRFYSSLGQGNTLSRAWKEAEDFVKIRKGSSNTRSLYFFIEEQEMAPDRFPWDIYYREGSEIVKEWNLPGAGNNPLFGLPEIPDSYELPAKPFRYLRRYTSADAKVFFGRSHFIQNLYTRVTDPKGAPIVMFHGQSGAGKSSCLDSGLLPRIEESHQVISVRRDQQLGLLGTLQEALGVASRDLNIVQLRQIAHDFGEKTKEKFEQFIQQLAEARTPDTGEIVFSAAEMEQFRQVGSLLPVWKAIEKKSGKPLVVILDQVEEMYTRPMTKVDTSSPFAEEVNMRMEGQKAEFALFLSALTRIFGNLKDLPQGKLILSYRKEYHSEIEEGIKKAELPRETLFLEHLNQKNIIEIIEAFGQRPYLKKAYNIQVEDDLAKTIAGDLTEKPDSPVAPVLQIILSKMWDLAVKEHPQEPRFTHALYNRIVAEGIEMRDFFLQQMRVLKTLQRELAPIVDSGLALDLLKFHVTDLGTAGSRQMEKIRDRYQEHQTEIDLLVENCSDLSLLASIGGHAQTMLAHDTLAPIVEVEFNESDKPAQRAARILAAKVMDIHALKKQGADQEAESIYLDEADLAIVENGKHFMRSLLPEEKHLIERSMIQRDKEKLQKKRTRMIQLGMLAALVLGTVIFGIYQRQAKQAIYEANFQRVQKNIERAKEAMRRLHYPEAFEYLKESAELEINPEQTLAGISELSFAYLNVDRPDTLYRVKEFLEACLPLVKDKKGLAAQLSAAEAAWSQQDTMAMLTALVAARDLISSEEETQQLREKYFPVMVPVAGGTFMMGTNTPGQDQADAAPAHEVFVSDFEMGKFEVTVAQYYLFAMSIDTIPGPESSGMPAPPATDWVAELPMVAVSHQDAENYGYWLSFMTGQDYRLPTEAEWEYAAKGGAAGQDFEYAGSDSIGSVAWYKGNTNYAKSGGSKPANALGIHDLSGNVREWCYDYYDPQYYRFPHPDGLAINPAGPDEPTETGGFVSRGGGYSDDPIIHKTIFRLPFNKLDDGSLYSDITLGFRMVRMLPSEQEEPEGVQ
ncbi:MAG: SUMF1/EgtB/PvdO family nonheme iron enzyme [Bacteroidia bacterium]|nr:SUMF1/EgtB/PvdO family nonheme iron enzyme [Bacteroidia bacterium]